MDPARILHTFCNACENGDAFTLDKALDPGFRFEHRADGRVLGRRDFLEAMLRLRRACPDLRLNLHQVRHGDPLRGAIQMTGTHTGVLDWRGLGGPRVLPTGRRFEMPTEQVAWTVRGRRITQQVVEATRGGGLRALLHHIQPRLLV